MRAGGGGVHRECVHVGEYQHMHWASASPPSLHTPPDTIHWVLRDVPLDFQRLPVVKWVGHDNAPFHQHFLIASSVFHSRNIHVAVQLHARHYLSALKQLNHVELASRCVLDLLEPRGPGHRIIEPVAAVLQPDHRPRRRRGPTVGLFPDCVQLKSEQYQYRIITRCEKTYPREGMSVRDFDVTCGCPHTHVSYNMCIPDLEYG